MIILLLRLKTLNKELKEEEARREENERKKQELEAKNKDRPKRLGKQKYPFNKGLSSY